MVAKDVLLIGLRKDIKKPPEIGGLCFLTVMDLYFIF